MADNVGVTPGSGVTVATDDIGGVQYQRVKVTFGTDGSATDASSSNPLPVTILASATNIAKAEDAAHASGDTGVQMLTVRKDAAAATSGTDGDYQPPITDSEGLLWVRPAPKKVRLQATPTISNGAIYASGDQIGGLMTLSNAARKLGGSGKIVSVTILDKTQAQRAAIDLLFFDRSVTVAGDNAVATFSDADMINCLGVISVATGDYNTAWAGTPANSIATKKDINLPYVLNGTDLFCVAVVRGTPTYTSTSDLVFSFSCEQD